MKFHASILVAILAAASARKIVDPKIVEAVNNAKTTWTATTDNFFSKHEAGDFQRLLGSKLGRDVNLPVRHHTDEVGDLPKEFDARTKWGSCIGPILNQGSCGSCWAFGAIESMSDRMCIEGGNNASFVQLSALDMVTCDDGIFGSNGCFGGEPSQAWQWAKSNGVVTESCRPYLQAEGGPIPTCPAAQQPCTNFAQTPQCTQKCSNGAEYSQDKHFVSSVYGIGSSQSDWMAELVKNGPFESAFTVYADFVHYKSGVYQHTTGAALGGHAIKIIGYGTENNTPYWLVQNSWTTQWGDGGYFKILRGQDECGIEDGGVAGTF